MDSTRKRQTIRFICIIAALVVGCPLLVYLGRIYGPQVWNNLHLVNFIVAWIPAVLSILVAFIPDKELEKRVRVGWRAAVIICGVLYSVFLWHQQTLTDKSNAESQNKAINDAVTKANAHTDAQFSSVTGKVDGVQQKVESVGEEFNSQLGKGLGDINNSIGKFGKIDPPTPARLVFSLWDPTATIEGPSLWKGVYPDSDGNFPIEFTFINASEATADSIDVWIQVCSRCTFVKEPAGFERPAGVDETIRHRTFGSLNPGVNFEKISILVKYPYTGSFQVAFRYTCKNCGGKVSSNQTATIMPLGFHAVPPPMRIPSSKSN